MSNGGGGVLFQSDGGVAADHPPQPTFAVLAGPTTGAEFNHIRLSIFPVGCLRLNDLRFAFDSSIVKPEAEAEFKQLPALMDRHPDCPLSVFGHADPVGTDDYNKTLSGRRAIAVYALLTRNIDLWINLYNNPFGGDDWRNWKAGGIMLRRLGFTADSDGLQQFQSSQGLPATGQGDDATRRAYFQAYMDAIGPPALTTDQFLGKGQDAGGKADYQGCSEFNPVLMFSAEDNQRLSQAENHKDRDTQNAPNRRVVIYLFCPYAKKIDPSQWPCPRASEGTAGCRARFWSDSDKRRQFQDNERHYEDTKDTFACRFYDRIATLSPCEGVITPVSTIVQVRLRLVYLDPNGTDRPFPAGFPVVVVFGDGSQQSFVLLEDGRLSFDTDQEKLSFTLQFSVPAGTYIASAPGAPAAGSETMVTTPAVSALVDKGSRVFLLPATFDLTNSDWSKSGVTLIKNAVPLPPGVTSVGSIGSPALFRLDPHWQYLLFLYFDRALKKKFSILLLMLEGFVDAAKSSGDPDTRSNWLVDPGNLGTQCLPWILQTPPKPDASILLRFRYVPGSFISSGADGKRALLSLDKLNPGGTDAARVADPGLNTGKVDSFVIDKPTPDRLRLYDLPVVWKSRSYAALQNVGGNPSRKFFEQIAASPTTASTPLVFCLDDMVLVNFGGGGLTPLSPFAPGQDRVAIYSHLFAEGGEVTLNGEGMFLQDDGNKQPHFSQAVDFLNQKINYIAQYPDWTRLVIAQGNLFDVFDQRTPDGATGVVGARAAVLWKDMTPPGGVVPAPGTPMPKRPGLAAAQAGQNFFRIEPFYEQHLDVNGIPRLPGFRDENVNPRPDTRSGGRVDVAVLRCCDLDNGVEVAVCLNYLRLFFNGNPTFAPGLQPNAIPSGLSNSDAEDWGKLGITHILQRWNGREAPFGAFRTKGKPKGPEPVRFDFIWLAQNLPRAISHFEIGIFKMPAGSPPPAMVRASLDPFGGFGTMDITSNLIQPGTVTPPHIAGDLQFAHEMGHAVSLDDEYIDPHLSYGFPWPLSPAPGAPFFTETFAMMVGGYIIQARYFWQMAEWLRSIYTIDLQLVHGPLTFELPHHRLSPKRTHVNWPLAEMIDASAATDPRLGPHAKFDAYLYPAGNDVYAGQWFLPKFPIDGILIVVVKVRVAFHTTNDASIREILGRMFTVPDFLLNVNPAMRVVATGSFGSWTFKRCAVVFGLRVLVETVSNDPNFLAVNNVANAAQYLQFVNGVEQQHRVHFHVATVATGPSLFTGATTCTFNSDPAHTLDFGSLFVEMLGLAPTVPATAASFDPIVQSVLKNGKAAIL